MNVFVSEYSLPTNYDENYLVLLLRDPNCFFAYWELNSEQMNLIANICKCTWGEVPLILRVYDITGINFDGQNIHSFFDVPIHPLSDNFYIKDVKANHSYCVDLGLIMSDGRFCTILRSNTIQTPRNSMADGSGIRMADLLDRLLKRQPESETLDVNPVETFSSEGVYVER